MRQYDIEALYPGLDRKAQLEEAIAQAFAEWQGAKGKHAPRFRRLFARIRDFLVDLGARLRRRAGYRTPEDGAGRLERLPPHRHRR